MDRATKSFKVFMILHETFNVHMVTETKLIENIRINIEINMILRNIRMAFHFLHKNMMRKISTTMITPKLEYAEVNGPCTK